MAEDNFAMGYAMGQDGNRNSGLFGGDGWWAIILFALIFGRGGFGGNSGANDNYVLASDFATIERKIDTVNGGLCDGFYAQNTNLLNGFAGVNNAITTNGYETRMGINGIGSQLADCCCTIRQQIADCCCENEKLTLQSKYDNAMMHTDTLSAIDKVGDRIIDYMSTEKMQTLRDENQALRLAASQSAQNQYIINQLRPYPVPSYPSCNPFAAVYGYNNNTCGCA